jgi:dTDP-4-amino-4,6-dideoxygalactose transaminase
MARINRDEISLFHPYIPEEATGEVAKIFKTRWLGQGPKVDLFEQKFSELFNVKYSVSLNSGSAALETAYDLLGLKAGDEVISTPLTCTATNIPLLRMGVKIIWADINPKTLCLDRKDVVKKITDKTKAIVNVHLGGIENDLGEMPVPIVSDSCQALGVFSGDYVCNSFQAIKHITTGDGGMLVVNNEREYHKAKLMRWFGIDREKKMENRWQALKHRAMTFDIEIIGYKRQMTDIAATLGIVGLRHYYEVLEYRTSLANLYKKLLGNLDFIKIIDAPKNVWWLFTILVDDREDFQTYMDDNKIDTNPVQLRNDTYKIFGGKRADLPVLNSIEEKYVSLPLHMKVTEDDVEYICSTIKKGW